MIQIKNLSFAYHQSNVSVIKDMSFNIRQGEIFGFLGPSGAGKTTTQRLIIGLLRHYEGSIQILGKERSAWGKEIYEHLGIAFDFPNLYLKLTAEENLLLMQRYYQNRESDINELLKRVDLWKHRHEKVEHFSKGMKMRLNFIRSILHQPEVVFLDEPTAGLDPVNGKIVREMILQMKSEGKTFFLTTHNMTVAESLCDRVAFINEGAIHALDTPKNLMFNHGEAKLQVESYQGSGVTLDRFSLEGLHANKDFQNLLEQGSIRTMHTLEASLEDVFIELTGRTLL